MATTTDADQKSEATKSDAASKKCHLLTLPPELRNRIYHMVFERTSRRAEILKTDPPRKDIMLACRQIYDEARLMHQQAYRVYWRTTIFTMTLPSFVQGGVTNSAEVELRAAIARLREDDIRHVSTVRGVRASNGSVWAFDSGVWTLWRKRGPTPCMMPNWREIWFQGAAVEEKLQEEGFATFAAGSRGWIAVTIRYEDAERIERAKEIIGQRGLSREELVMVLVE